MLNRFLIILGLFWIAQCEYKHQIAKKHKTLDLVDIFEELFLIENMKCGSDFNKNNTEKACLCEISKDDSQCCETAAKCTGAETKVCTASALTCKDDLNKGVKYYKKENEQIDEKLYCEKTTGNGPCYCGLMYLDISCCANKDKCQTNQNLVQVCNEKVLNELACQKELDALMVKAKFEKPWFYERVDDLNSAYTLMTRFGLLALLALF